MNCEEILAVLVDYLNGELIVEHHETVQIHIQGCPHCESYVATYTHTVSIARTLPKCGKLPQAFEERLRAVLAEHLEDGKE